MMDIPIFLIIRIINVLFLTFTVSINIILYFSNLKSNNSIAFPPMNTDLPCECKPGYGEKQLEAGKIECTKCTKGQFSHGGELIDNWKNWNGTNGVPGSGYTAYPYCSDFLTGKDCESWKPGGK